MNLNLLEKKVQQYIVEHLKSDTVRLLFKKSKFQGISQQEIVEQIESKAKSEKKLPSWFSAKGIYYPNKLNISQTSSEITANYKAQLVSGKTLIDLTGGFGVDTFAFSKKVEKVIYVEQNEELSKIAAHNFNKLNAVNIDVKNNNGSILLENDNTKYDWIYVDPSRRSEAKERVFLLKDCSPDIILNLESYFKRTNNILIKTGPLLDITSGLNDLENVKEVHVVAFDNEVKELLWVLKKGFTGRTLIKTINLTKTKEQRFTFYFDDEQKGTSTYSEPLSYLYEPNAAILKSGAFTQLGKKLGLFKLHKHSHLYTSDKPIDFPGRIFRINKTMPISKKNMAVYKNAKANITTRNFPLSVASIRKTYKIKTGGEVYLFFTTKCDDILVSIDSNKI